MKSPQSFDHNLSKTEIRRLVGKYWHVVLITFLTGTVAMWAIMPIFFTELYETQVRLLVKIGRENVETPGTIRNGQVFSQGVRVADTNSEVQILSSRILVERVVDRLGPDAFKSVLVPPKEWWGYPKYWVKSVAREAKKVYQEFLILASLKKRLTPREAAIVAVSGGVKVEPIRDSDILVLKVQTPGAQLSVEVIKTLLDEYFRSRLEARRNSAGADFFAAQVTEARQRLSATAADRNSIRQRHQIDVPEQQRQQYLEQLANLKGEQVRIDAQIAQLRQQSRVMSARVGSLPSQVDKERVEGRNPALEPIVDRITQLRLERAKIASRYQPDSELMRKLDREIADLDSVLAKEKPIVVSSLTVQANPERRGFESAVDQSAVEIAGLETRRKQLAEPIARLESRVREATVALDELEASSREYKRAEEEYLLYAKRLEEARMSEALDARRVANVVAVETPETPIEPVYPKKIFLMQVAMGASLVLGIALAAIIETTEDRILDEDSLTAVGDLAYLGTVKLHKVA